MRRNPLTHRGCQLALPVFSAGALILALFWLLSLPIPVARAAGQWYVNPAGNDSGGCTLPLTGACRTIAGAVNKASSGDTIQIAAGTYPENINITGKVLTFIGAGMSNTVVDGGGVDHVFISDSDITLASLTIQNGADQDTSAVHYGGGLHTDGTLALTSVAVLSNTTVATRGGGAYAHGAVTLSGGLFQNNSCPGGDGAGGGLYTDNTLTVTGTRFISNTADLYGGGAFAAGEVRLSGGRFQNNHSVIGGGLYAVGTLALTDTQFLTNTAQLPHGAGGGGAYAGDAATISGGLFQNNACTGSPCWGGGLYTYQNSLTVSGTQFLSNTASHGGGLYVELNATLVRVVNTLFASNRSTSHNGNALYLSSPGTVQILHATIDAGSGPSGAAVYVQDGNVNIANTIFTNFIDGYGLYRQAGTVNEDYDLYFYNDTHTHGITPGAHDVFADPAFVNPGDYNYHLKTGSAAIDKGENAGVTTDLDGNPRPVGAGFDIGAYEYTSSVLTLVTVGDGAVMPPAGIYTYTYGAEVALTATANFGSRFSGWSGDLTGTANPTIVTMKGNQTVTATFAINNPPVANAGANHTVKSRSLVTLDGSASSDPDGDLPLTYNWAQAGGPAVTLSSAAANQPTFTAPSAITHTSQLTFMLTVSDSWGLPGTTPAQVVITVEPYRVFLPAVIK